MDEELHRATLLNMSDAVFITTDDGAFTFVCPNVDVIFGYGEDEVRAMRSIADLLGRELMSLADLSVAGGEIRNIEHQIRTKAGASRIVLVHIKRVAIKRGTIMYVCRDVTERREAEHAHRRSEERLKLALEAANAGTWDWDLPADQMHWSPEIDRLFGDGTSKWTPALRSFLDRVHPLDRERVACTLSEAMDRAASFETEFRLVGDGTAVGDRAAERWVLGKGKALRNGKPLRMLGILVDVTDRHRAEQELRSLSGRIIEAHEEQRKRLSRELHDGVGQRLALLSAELALLRRELSGEPRVLEFVRRLSEHTEEVGTEIHRVSHELHPAILEQLGLSAAIRRLCQELAAAHQILMHLEVDDAPSTITNDVALAVYRIAQEALHNVVRHSGAANATVRLAAGVDEIVLSVLDDGRGFDARTTGANTGIGLISMEERSRHVAGRLTLTSMPGQGTRIETRVPLC